MCAIIVAIHISKCLEMPYSCHMRYTEYLCDVLCHVIGIIFNQLFDLIIVNDCRHAGKFSDFPNKISDSEPSEQLTNSTLGYGNISINNTYLFYAYLERKVNHIIFLQFHIEQSTFKVDNQYTILIEGRFEIYSFKI